MLRSTIFPVLGLLSACKPNCPDEGYVTDRNGYQCTPIPNYTITSTEPESSSSSESSTSDSSSSTTVSADTSTSTGESTTEEPFPVCGDDICDPAESAMSCYEDCGVCGDGVLGGPEACDNGQNQDAPYSPTPPAPGACAPGCLPVEFCGDSVQNGPEPCDAGLQTARCEADCRLPACGDGTLNVLAGESCDDGNMADGDGCSADCLSERRMFTSSITFKGDLNAAVDNPDMLAGIPLADARCNALAVAAGLSPTFKAWLSTSTESPATRFDTSFTGLYRLLSPGFPVVAAGWSDLTDASLAHAIDADETGALTQNIVFTNTATDGSYASDLHCAGWTKNDIMSTTIIGLPDATDAIWTNAVGGQVCSNSYSIYCFEDP